MGVVKRAQSPVPAPISGGASEDSPLTARPVPLQRRSGARRFRGAALAAACLVAIAALRILVLQPTVVTSASMQPTIDAGGVVWINVLAPRLGPVEAGSLVSARLPDGSTVVKRLVATGGQTVELYEGALRIDGRELDEPYADSRDMGGIFFGPIRVPEGSVFLMGDNRIESIDSRVFGPVDENDLQGVVAAAWPRIF
jgi:signal peptidase I